MSYDLYLKDADGNICTLPEGAAPAGGTYAVGGTSQAEFNITYNYAWFFYRLLDKEKGIRVLYGKTGAESIPLLEVAIAQFYENDKPYQDYWVPTPGNAKAALLGCLQLAKACPEGIWEGD